MKLRLAGIRKPAWKPKVALVRRPLWAPNRTGDPIYSVSGDPAFGGSAVTLATPAVVNRCWHNYNPGTVYLKQDADSAMAWTIDRYFAFKCFFELDSVSGRIPIWSRRSSLDNGGPFIEVRDGYVYAGWYDVELKEEVWVRTDKPIVEPGYTYYLYHRKWFPRGGVNNTNAFYSPAGSNWLNSVHTGTLVTNTFVFDSLIVRRVPKAAQTGYYDFTGYDLKSYKANAAYDYPANGSSARACVSFTIADSTFSPNNPYSWGFLPGATGCVAANVAVNRAATNAAGDRIILDGATSGPRFLLDHVGMLCQVADDSGATPLRSDVYRIVEFISALEVRVVNQADASPAFALPAANCAVHIFSGVSLVKSPNYDRSKSPDPEAYAVEAFGTSLASNVLNGVQPFRGRRWSLAWNVVSNGTADVNGNRVGLPDIFEDISVRLGTQVSSAIEVGTDLFGTQGSTNPLDGSLPWQGVPLGELQADNTFVRVAVDTRPYHVINWAAPAGSATAPASTLPNSALALALDASATSVTPPAWDYSRAVTAGERLLRVSFFDPDNNEESEPGDLVTFEIPIEDGSNPSAGVSLRLTGLPYPTESDRRIQRRIRLSLANGFDLFTVLDHGQDSSSVEFEIDEISMAFGSAVTEGTIQGLYGRPPRARFVAFTSGRLLAANLRGQPDGLAYSRPYLPETFAPENVTPIDTGDAEITGLVTIGPTIFVFKRNAILGYRFDNFSQPFLTSSVRGDGCVAPSSIAALEDRIYYLSDRGPMVLPLEASVPFFVGWRFKGLPRDTGSQHLSHSAINRGRSQCLMTYAEAPGAPMDRALAMDFDHPMDGEDTTRAELVSGHRMGRREWARISSMAYGIGGLQPRMACGTEDGFVAWMDVEGEPEIMRASGTGLEGRAGSVAVDASDWTNWDHVVYDSAGLWAPDGQWLSVPGVGVVRSLWSTKTFNAGTPDIRKNAYYLDVERDVGAGKMTIDVYKDQGPTVGPVTIDLSLSYSSEELGGILQEARSFRFAMRAHEVGVRYDLLSVTLRVAAVESL